MGRKKKDVTVVQISFSIDPVHLKHLKNMCYEMSYRDSKKYTLSSIIRETLLQVYPPPKNIQMDLFENKGKT